MEGGEEGGGARGRGGGEGVKEEESFVFAGEDGLWRGEWGRKDLVEQAREEVCEAERGCARCGVLEDCQGTCQRCAGGDVLAHGVA